MKPATALLSGNRLHLQHGPIDLIIGVDGDRDLAFQAARTRFETVLSGLVGELSFLRRPLLPGAANPQDPVARRMVAACAPFTSDFITPMAAVAGSVADDVLSAILNATQPQRAYVNNGGDIAVFTAENQTFTTAIQDHTGRDLARISLAHGDNIGGIATSGRHGRSHSLGIADSVTVLARTAAEADVAATLIANAVDLPGHPAIARTPARTLSPDSDLGDMPVVTGLGPLASGDIDTALDAGMHRARAFCAAHHIKAAALFLRGETRVLGDGFAPKELTMERTQP